MWLTHTPNPVAPPLHALQLILGALAACVASFAVLVACVRRTLELAPQPEVAASLSLVAPTAARAMYLVRDARA